MTAADDAVRASVIAAVDAALERAGIGPGAAFVPVPATSRVLGASEWATYGAIKRGELPAVRIGRRLLIARGTILRLALGDADVQREC